MNFIFYSGDDDLKAYRYNKEKALDWLKAKVERIAQTLEHSTVHCAASGSQSATFVRSSKGKEATKGMYISVFKTRFPNIVCPASTTYL